MLLCRSALVCAKASGELAIRIAATAAVKLEFFKISLLYCNADLDKQRIVLPGSKKSFAEKSNNMKQKQQDDDRDRDPQQPQQNAPAHDLTPQSCRNSDRERSPDNAVTHCLPTISPAILQDNEAVRRRFRKKTAGSALRGSSNAEARSMAIPMKAITEIRPGDPPLGNHWT
jgi:hypothetical protein